MLPITPAADASSSAARQAAAFASSTTPDRADYHACWQRWLTTTPCAPRERRELAVETMKRCLHSASMTLNLSEMGLRSLPALLPPCHILWLTHNKLEHLAVPLPDMLTELRLNDNELEQLPDSLPPGLKALSVQHNHLLRQLPPRLPETLEKLDISYCRITTLPELPGGLKMLQASGNPFRKLPSTLPDTLEHLSLLGCAQSELPERLPAALLRLNIASNMLTSLPDSLPDGLKVLIVRDNPLRALPDNLPGRLEMLDASRCDLSALPSLPGMLLRLYAPENGIHQLPDAFPGMLKWLGLGYNSLTRLPDNLPVSLTNIAINNNPLRELPETLPGALEQVLAASCRLRTLPSRLPPGLRHLDVAANRITHLPESLLHLSSDCFVYLEANPLSARLLRALPDTLYADDYSGPHISFSLASPQEVRPLRSLPSEAAGWYAQSSRRKVRGQWLAIKEEAGADAFRHFLYRLRETVNATQDADFRSRIVSWLSRLAASSTLRSETFMLAQEATSSCEDRVTFYFNQMLRLEAIQQIDNGSYDSRLPELVQQARQLFRIEQLQLLAQQKVKSLRFVDEIEVWLAYQVKLRTALQLEMVAPRMRFFSVSGVSEEDLSRASEQVRQAEREQFTDWLASWAPWKNLLQRLDTPRYAATEQQRHALVDQFYPELRYQEALVALREASAEADPEARAGISKLILDREQQRLDLTLTRDFLQARRLSGLLDEAG